VAYALLVGELLLLAWPRARPLALGAATFAGCFAIELLQLTGLTRRAPALWRLALGDTFAWHDVACYGVGALLLAAVLRTFTTGLE
jgi:hypothetical protein